MELWRAPVCRAPKVQVGIEPMKLSGKRTEQFGAAVIFYGIVPIVVFFRVKSYDLTLFVFGGRPIHCRFPGGIQEGTLRMLEAQFTRDNRRGRGFNNEKGKF